MSSDERIRRRNGIRLPMLILGVIMTLIYVGLGSYLLLNRAFLPYIPVELRNVFAVLLIIYGGYRAWRVYADYW